MPGAVSPLGPPRKRFIAPRALNEPVTCRHSSLRVTRAALGAGDCSWTSGVTGVRRTQPAIRWRAASISAMSIIGPFHHLVDAPLHLGGVVRLERAELEDAAKLALRRQQAEIALGLLRRVAV